MAQAQEIELIPVYSFDGSLLRAYFHIPDGACFPNLDFFDPWLINCDTQDGAEFINLNPLKMILRVNGVETL